MAQETAGECEECDCDDEFLNCHDEKEVMDEVGDGEYLYSQGVEEDGREADEEDDDFIDNNLSTSAKAIFKHGGNEQNMDPLYR